MRVDEKVAGKLRRNMTKTLSAAEKHTLPITIIQKTNMIFLFLHV